MKVVILGSGTGVPIPQRQSAGIYVRAGREHLLLDCGPGSVWRLAKIGVRWLELDRVFITHFHPDHCGDLVALLFAMRIRHPSRRKPLYIYGPNGLKRLVKRLTVAFNGWLAPRNYRLVLRELDETTITGPGWRVRTRRMRHSTAALGYRLESNGKSLVYSGDTDACRAIVELGHRADCLIVECSLPDECKAAGHLTPSECGRLAAAAECRQLVLTHFYPVFGDYDIRRRIRRSYPGPVRLARDLATWSV